MIYVASPYSHPDKNVMEIRFKQVAEFTVNLMKNGIAAYSPIVHGHTLAQLHDLPKDFEWWEYQCLEALKVCEKLIVLKLDGWEESKGVRAEIEYAEIHNIPIVYERT